jgi:thiol-disulfide isomerase/thioredoxin
MKLLSPEFIENAMDYKAYKNLLNQLIEEEKTTGPNQEDWLVDYARLNIQRMNRLDKTWTVPDKIENRLLSFDTPLTFLTITEGWCGDAAQIVPIIDKLASANPLISHRLILRDENPEIMDQFLTKGTRSIPKIIILETGSDKVLASWGPRPSGAAELLNQLKSENNLPKEERYSQLHAWYAKDKGAQIAKEFTKAVEEALAAINV